MLFNSWQFFVFLPPVLLLYALSSHHGHGRRSLLLLASCLFYMAFIPAYILILWLLIGIDFAAGLGLAATHGITKRVLLAASLAANLGILGFFKYWNFFVATLTMTPPAISLPLQHYLLPIGLSFHTFQSMAYTIEVYRGTVPAERNLVTYALYVLFFPQMVAGPIERPGISPGGTPGLLRQLHRGPEAMRWRDGLRLMLLGYAKKVLIADRLSTFVQATYDHPHDYLGPRLWLATFFFSVQIYCDFSGYTDIARGLARLLGYELMVNFRRPYSARSIGEFWQRWHISLSTWFRDYVYIPLGGSRQGPGRRALNVLATFALSGLWHGANWTFMLWGLWHGLGLCLENLLPRGRSWLTTFLWVQIGWVFFRATDVGTACYVLCGGFIDGFSLSAILGEDAGTTMVDLLLALAFLIYEVAAERAAPAEELLLARPTWERHTFYVLLILAILFLGRWSSNEFIYFQF